MADDRYEIWLAEKVWELIPAFYRHEDGLGDNPGVLRALVEVMARQGAILRRSQDHLWDDQSPETADDWAIPYLAELLATRLVSALNPRGRRVDVRKTVYYRRRSGTVRVLEELASDIAGWESKVVEGFRRLARARHGLDPVVAEVRGRFSGTPAGGTADLRRPVSAEAADGPFDEFHHTPDLRRPSGRIGRYGIPRLGFHLYRSISYRVERSTPGSATLPTGEIVRTFDPSGRDIPLFCPAARPGADDGDREQATSVWDVWRSAREWELPTPMRCRILGHAEYTVTDEGIGALRDETGLTAANAATLLPLRGVVFPNEGALSAVLRSLPNAAQFDPVARPGRYRVLLREALVEDCGKAFLEPDYLAVELNVVGVVPRQSTVAGAVDPTALPTVAARTLLVDAERGRFAQIAGPVRQPRSVTYHYGFPGKVGAGPFPRGLLPTPTRTYSFDLSGSRVLLDHVGDDNGVVEVADDATYNDVHNRLAVGDLTVQAGDGERPFLQLGRNWRLVAAAAGDSVLVLDGLWVGSRGNFQLRIEGDWESVTLRFCTLDPGGTDAAGQALFPVGLSIRGHVETLIVDRCILASVRTAGAGVVERFELRDSIVAGTVGAEPAVSLPRAEVYLDRVTVAGGVEVRRLHASEALLVDPTVVADTQWGCVRFSAYRTGSLLPRPYESHARAEFAAAFTSRRFGDPGFFQLSAVAGPELLRGAESGSEIGAYSGLVNAIKADSLAAKVDEYAPFGVIPTWIEQT